MTRKQLHKKIYKHASTSSTAQAANQVKNVLIASEGRPFNAEVIKQAANLLQSVGGHVRVLSVARLWGTSFGLPNPGLRPSKKEMDEQEENVAWAIMQLNKRGISADGHIVTTRNPRKSIHKEANRQQSDVIIMGADPCRSWIVRPLMWSQEPYRVRSRAPVPVHLVYTPG